tara:strand:+ start:93 stop:959 length:867 start_codon:yes stop_codon:yes gene_type:complete
MSGLPSHIKYCIKQIRYTNPDYKIYFLTNLNIEPPNDSKIKIVNINEFDAPDVSGYFSHDIPEHVQLMQTAVLRVFYLEKFLEKYNVQDVIHFDNDIVLYTDLQKFEKTFKKFNFLITPHFETEYVFGFSYIKNSEALVEVNKNLLQLVNLPLNELQQKVNHECPHEMRILRYINSSNDMKLIDHLPVVPSHEGSDNFELFNSIFDPSTYGKHVGGSHELIPKNKYYVPTENWNGTEKHHYAGKQIIEKSIEVNFTNKEPYVKCNDGKKYDIVNLHIHTKELDKFITY